MQRHNVQWANDEPGHPKLTANEKAFNASALLTWSLFLLLRSRSFWRSLKFFVPMIYQNIFWSYQSWTISKLRVKSKLWKKIKCNFRKANPSLCKLARSETFSSIYRNGTWARLYCILCIIGIYRHTLTVCIGT